MSKTRRWRLSKRGINRLELAKNKYLDALGCNVGIERKTRKVFFGIITIQESNKKYRQRILQVLKEYRSGWQ